MFSKQDIQDDEIEDITIEGEDLRSFDFSRKRLSGVCFINTDLSFSNFSYATLKDVRFINSNLTSASFDSSFNFLYFSSDSIKVEIPVVNPAV